MFEVFATSLDTIDDLRERRRAAKRRARSAHGEGNRTMARLNMKAAAMFTIVILSLIAVAAKAAQTS